MKHRGIFLGLIFGFFGNQALATEIGQCWKAVSAPRGWTLPTEVCVDQLFVSPDFFSGAQATVIGKPFAGKFNLVKKVGKNGIYRVRLPLISKVDGGGCGEMEVQNLSLVFTVDRLGDILGAESAAVEADYLQIPDGCHSSRIPQPVEFH